MYIITQSFMLSNLGQICFRLIHTLQIFYQLRFAESAAQLQLHIFNIRFDSSSCTTESHTFVLTLIIVYLLYSRSILSLCRSANDIPFLGTSLTTLSPISFLSECAGSISLVDLTTVGAVGNQLLLTGYQGCSKTAFV